MVAMRIVHIIPTLNIGGAERLALDISQRLGKMGHAVKLLVLHENGEYILPKNATFMVEFLQEDFELHFLRGSKHYPSKLYSAIKTFNPDIIHSHLQESEFLSRLIPLSKDHKTAWFTHCHDSMPRLRPPSTFAPWKKSWIVSWYEHLLLRKLYKQKQPQHFIAISKSEKKYVADSKSVRGEITLLSNAINYHKFTKNPKQKEPDFLSLINVGSFQTKKNQAYLLRVLGHLKKQKQFHSKLTCLGDGPLRAPFIEEAERLGLSSSVASEGNVNQVAPYLWKNTLYVHSAKYEPFGLVLVEAMAAGLPVIALDAGGNRDIVKDGLNGYLLPQDTRPEEFAEKIIAVWEDKELLRSLQKGAIETAALYDIKPYCKKLVKLYEDALRQVNRFKNAV